MSVQIKKSIYFGCHSRCHQWVYRCRQNWTKK